MRVQGSDRRAVVDAVVLGYYAYHVQQGGLDLRACIEYNTLYELMGLERCLVFSLNALLILIDSLIMAVHFMAFSGAMTKIK